MRVLTQWGIVGIVILGVVIFAIETPALSQTKNQGNDQEEPTEHQPQTSPKTSPEISRNNPGDTDQMSQGNDSKKNDQNRFWRKVIRWVDARDKVVVALSTVVMASFTVALSIATFMLWWGGERHSERELRAYLSVLPKALICRAGTVEIAGIDCLVKNHGQTPAFEISYVFAVDAFTFPLGPDFKFPTPTIRMDHNTASFPASETSMWFVSPRLLTAEEMSEIENGTRRVFLWGTMTYRDAFKKRRYTNFSASAGGRELVENLRAFRDGREGQSYRWAYGDRNNEAT